MVDPIFIIIQILYVIILRTNMKKFTLKPNKYTEAAGWYGMLAILGAYALVSFNLVQSDSLAFQLLNLTGAVGLIVVAASKGVTQSVILNIFWGAVALIALFNIFIS